jgi:protoheme IX farnesyltransferase
VVATFDETAKRIVAYTVVLWATSLVFWPAGSMGWIYLAAAMVLGGLFTWKAVVLARSHRPDLAMKLFRYSITYITLLFGAMAADQLLLH